MKAHLLSILVLLCIALLFFGLVYYPIETVIVFSILGIGCFYWMLYYFFKED